MSNTNNSNTQQQNQQTEPNGQTSQQSAQPAFDYEKLASLINGKQNAAEDTVLKSYFREQGLSADEMKQAIASFKEQKAKNTPNVAEIQSSLADEKKARLKAELKSAAQLEAVRQGVDVKSIPYVLKMTDYKDCLNEKGEISAEKLTEAVKKVLEDIPALKGAQSSTARVQKVGGDGEGNSGGTKPQQKAVPQKKWNRFNI